MVKKSTLIVLLAAILIGGGVYYYSARQEKKEETPKSKAKPAFDIRADEITAITLSFPAKPDSPAIQLAKNNGQWEILKPVETGADPSAVGGISNGLAAALVGGTESGAPDRLKAFGLDPGAVRIEFQGKGGAKHTLLLGDKDFTGDSVYAIADGAKTVDLLPQTLLVSADKSLDDLRDKRILRIEAESVTSFDLKNASGEISAAKNPSGWTLSKPADKPADTETISGLLAGVSAGRMAAVTSETPENLAKYGLSSPAITLTTTDAKGNKQTLIVGKKQGDAYYARDISRPMIFTIHDDLYSKLTEKAGDFRDKYVLRFQPDQINRVEVQNPGGKIVMFRKEAGKEDWVFLEPAGEKDKAAASWKVFSPMEDARAVDVLDHAPANISVQLAKPAIEVVLIDKDGKKTTLDLTKPDGDFGYARSSASDTVFKVKKDFYEDLNFTAAQAEF